jgi:Flp pilus assembly protein TadD
MSSNIILWKRPIWRLIVAVLLMVNGLLVGCRWWQIGSEKTDLVFAEANRLYGERNYAAAQEKYLWLVDHVPPNPRLENNVGNVCFKLGDFSEARRHYERALELNKGYIIARVNLAVLSLHYEKKKEASQVFREILSSYEDDADLHNGLGVCALREDKVKEGVDHFRKAIDIQGESAPLYNNLAFAYAEANEYLNESLKMAREALKAEPKNPVFLDTLGWVYFKRGVFEQAIDTLREALDLAPKSEKIRSHLVTVYRWIGREDDALSLLRDGNKERTMTKR